MALNGLILYRFKYSKDDETHYFSSLSFYLDPLSINLSKLKIHRKSIQYIFEISIFFIFLIVEQRIPNTASAVNPRRGAY